MITVLSGYYLVAAACFSMASFIVLVRAQEGGSWLWLVLAICFTFFAFDETLTFHEWVGSIIDDRADSGGFRNWNDVIVLTYGLVALPIMVAIFPILLRYRMVAELFVIGFSFFAVHTLIDSTQEPPTTISHILEESAKLFCGANLALGAFVGFLGVLWNFPAISSKTDDSTV